MRLNDFAKMRLEFIGIRLIIILFKFKVMSKICRYFIHKWNSKWKRKIAVFTIAMLFLSATFFAFSIPFLDGILCLNRPFHCGILVVESWVPESAHSEISSIYNSEEYEMIVVVGNSKFSGQSKKQGLNEVHLIESRLIADGIKKDSIISLLYDSGKYHHTYHRAVALKDWLSKSKISSICVDIYTGGFHAMKSHIIFKRVLSPNYEVGIISGTPCPENWFLSRHGIYLAYKNFFGYLYGKFIPFQFISSNAN